MTTETLKRSVLPWLICALGAVFYCYEFFLRISPGVMTKELMSAYHLTAGAMGGLIGLYYQAYTPLQILVGLLMDRYGPRRLLTLACFLCAIGTYMFMGQHGMLLVKLGRFLVGFGSAFAFVGALKLATIWLPPNRFALVSGIILCLGMIGGMVGNVLLRHMVESVGWQNTLYISAVVGAFLAVILWFIVRDTSPDHPDHSSHVLPFKTVFIGLWEAIKNPQIWMNACVGCLMYLSLSGFAELWAPMYLEQGHGLSPTHAAWANSMVFLGWAVGGPAWGWFSDYIKRRCLPLRLGAFLSLIMVSLILYYPSLPNFMLGSWHISTLYILLFMLGFFSSVQILVFAICHEASKMRIAGTAIALTNMIVMIGGNIFQPALGKLLDLCWDNTLLDGVRVYSPHAFQLTLSVMPIGLLIALLLTFFIRETYCSMQR